MNQNKLFSMQTAAFSGLEAICIEVEAEISNGLPRFVIVGLPDAVVSESRVRISRALSNYLPPTKVITVNLSPAHIKKEGSHYDLPIALCLLVALKILPESILDEFVAFGELTLNGRILPCKGVLLAAMSAQEHKKKLICSKESAADVALLGVQVIGANTLQEIIDFFQNNSALDLYHHNIYAPEPKVETVDFSQVKGQESAKLALEIAAAGGHHALMIGSPGSGKSMLAQRFNTILPNLTAQQSLEATLIYNLAGKPIRNLLISAPFREVHHSASTPAMVGGGSFATPGEISLAHNGVLFLDEFPEFNRSTLQALREAMETGKITVSRAQAHHSYPARFQLIAAMNPCKCGMLGEGKCKSGPKCASDYWAKISGPLLDRFDLCVYMQNLAPWQLCEIETKSDTSLHIRTRVAKCRAVQINRQGCLNADLMGEKMEEFTFLNQDLRAFAYSVAKKFALSSRGFAKLLKTARTIADLAEKEHIDKSALTLASSFRFMWN